MSELEQTIETVEAPEVPASTEGGGDTPEHGAAPVESQPAAYTPNFKFKVYDEEKEIPESFRALMKDQATEKEVRELFEKAHGLDGLKPTHQKVVKERDELTQRYKDTEGHLNSTVDNLKKIHHYSQNDLDTFFQIYKIPEDKLFQYVAGKLKESELPPDQLEQINSGRQAKIEADYYRDQVDQQRRQSQEHFKQQHEMGMSQQLANPEVANFAKDFDLRAGQQGAFLKHVNDYGNQVYQAQNGRYVPPQEAVAHVYQYYRSLINHNPSHQAATGLSQAPEAPPPPIPNIGSSGSVSPTKATYKSLDQLRKRAMEFKEA